MEMLEKLEKVGCSFYKVEGRRIYKFVLLLVKTGKILQSLSMRTEKLCCFLWKVMSFAESVSTEQLGLS